MADRNKIVKNIKDGGALVIYVGTASLMKPYITRDNDERSAVGKVCGTVAGAAASFGIAGFACKAFNKIVDEVDHFIEDISGKKDKNTTEGGDQNA